MLRNLYILLIMCFSKRSYKIIPTGHPAEYLGEEWSGNGIDASSSNIHSLLTKLHVDLSPAHLRTPILNACHQFNIYSPVMFPPSCTPSVGRAISLAEREIKKLNGTIHRHRKKKDISCTHNNKERETTSLHNTLSKATHGYTHTHMPSFK